MVFLNVKDLWSKSKPRVGFSLFLWLWLECRTLFIPGALGKKCLKRFCFVFLNMETHQVVTLLKIMDTHAQPHPYQIRIDRFNRLLSEEGQEKLPLNWLNPLFHVDNAASEKCVQCDGFLPHRDDFFVRELQHKRIKPFEGFNLDPHKREQVIKERLLLGSIIVNGQWDGLFKHMTVLSWMQRCKGRGDFYFQGA